MRSWWPRRARAAWDGLSKRRKARARAIVHWTVCEFDGLVLDQRDLVDLIETKDALPRDLVVETIVHLARKGLLRRTRSQGRTRVWMPPRLLDPPGEP